MRLRDFWIVLVSLMLVSFIALQTYLISSGLVVQGIKLLPWMVSRNLYWAAGIAVFALWRYLHSSDEFFRKLQILLIFASVIWAGSTILLLNTREQIQIVLLTNTREHIQIVAGLNMAMGDFVALLLIGSFVRAASTKRHSTTAAS